MYQLNVLGRVIPASMPPKIYFGGRLSLYAVENGPIPRSVINVIDDHCERF